MLRLRNVFLLIVKFFYALCSINKIIFDFFLSYFRPGVGKTTVMREIARVLSDEFQKRVVSTDFLYYQHFFHFQSLV